MTDIPTHEIFVVLSGELVWDADTKTLKDGPIDTYHSVYRSKELARKACRILKHEDEISGLHNTLFRVADDTIQDKLPEQDPGMALTEEELNHD